MTFAEILIFILVMALLFFLMNPLRLRIEKYFYKMLNRKSSSKNKPVDIPLHQSEYTKKENNHE